MSDKLKPWEEHWPEGCDFFIERNGKKFFASDAMTWRQFGEEWPEDWVMLAAHVAHSVFLCKARKLYEHGDLSQEVEEAIEQAEQSAAAWAKWGGI